MCSHYIKENIIKGAGEGVGGIGGVGGVGGIMGNSSTDKSHYFEGDSIIVSWSDFQNGTNNDRVAIYPAHSTNDGRKS